MSEEFVLPTFGGLYLRDAIQGTITDADESTREVQVKFPHDTVDTYKTTFDPHAFVDSFHHRMPLMCWQHDMRDPIGHATKAQATRSANEITGKFSDFDAVPNSKRAYSQIQDGTITDFSFGFRHPKFEKHKRIPGVRNIRSAEMMEFSPVSIGSIPGAVVTGLREEDLMSEHSVDEIRGLVEQELITREEGRAMLATMGDFKEVIHVRVPADPEAGGGGEETPDLDALLAGLDDDDERSAEEPELPEELTAASIVDILPDSWREALDGSSLHVVPDGMTVRVVDADAEEADIRGAVDVAETILAAAEQAEEWMGDVNVEEQPEGVRSALALYRAAGQSADALLELLGQRASTEPSDDPDAEDMDPHTVKCDMCNGSGEVQNGAICPQCNGSGIEAVTRALPDDAPEGAKVCPTCKGSGKMLKGHMKCKTCNGKGWLTADQADDHGKRSDASSWSNKAWSGFPASKYTPEQYKAACLVSDGDTKADCHLPVKEPDGTYNRNAIHAAASRINGTKLSAEDKASAANKLVDLYRTMGEDVPPDVSKLATRDDEDEADVRAAAIVAKLDRRLPKDEGAETGSAEVSTEEPVVAATA